MQSMTVASENPFLALITAGALLAGCQTLPSSVPTVFSGNIAGVRRAEMAGEYIVAAERLKALSRQAIAPQKQRFEIEAADDLRRAGQVAQAQRILASVRIGPGEPALMDRKTLVAAQIKFVLGHPKTAAQLLARLRSRRLAPRLLAEADELHASLLVAQGHPIAAARVLVRREHLLVRHSDIKENRQQLWSILSQMSRSRLETAQVSNPVLAGWIALAKIVHETAAGSAQRQQALTAWKGRYPDHPASGRFLAALSAGAPPMPSRFRRIALLLPLTSRYSIAAHAVESGFFGMAAAHPDPGHPQINVYDIGSNPDAAGKFYRRAERQGAQLIIGPLGRDAARALLASTTLKVPTLLFIHTKTAINAPDGNVFQFGLPAQQEARQVAERAFVDGHRGAAVLYPDTPWGQRVASAFSTYWEKLGGSVDASQSYTPGLSQYAGPVERLLNITQSLQRAQMLRNLLQMRLKFESRRRQDIDFVFLAADPEDGRLIKPQLDYHHADSLPVYSTSNIFGATADPADDRDLDGVTFGDMPWILIGNGRMGRLRAELANDQPYVNSPLDRLYALGMDSYAILPHLGALAADPGATFQGATGMLSVGANGVVHRQLVWARFEKGLPRLVDHFLKYRGRFAADKKMIIPPPPLS
ncbi:MAG: penicillin-binding protein activator [Acidiferrobacteraceae bacterium]